MMNKFSMLMNRRQQAFGEIRVSAIAITFLLAVISLPIPLHQSYAQNYPSKPIELVVPFAPGGAADLMARTIAGPMEKDLGKPIVVINRGGAGTVLGVDSVAKAVPDGHTLLLSGDAGVINSASGRPLPYDLMKDLAPISAVYMGVQIMVANKDSRFKSIQDLVQYGKANPGKVSFGSSGVGSVTHLSAELFNIGAGIKALHVPFKGISEAMNAVMGGHIDYAICGSSVGISAIKQGSLRGLALTGKTRSALIPELPTLIEQGVNVTTFGWYGLYTTARTPTQVVEKLNTSLVKALNSQAIRDSFLKMGGEPTPMTSEEFSSYTRNEIEKLGKVIKQLNIKLE